MKTWLVIHVPKGERLASQTRPELAVVTGGDDESIAPDVLEQAVLELQERLDRENHPGTAPIETVVAIDLDAATRYDVDVSPRVSIVTVGSL